jgi:DNA-binding response OmpR family regulator
MRRAYATFRSPTVRLGTAGPGDDSVVTVLIIDDDDDIRLIAAMSLTRIGGLEVIQAASGAEGVGIAHETVPDVILLDLMMPMMDGVETLASLRAQPSTALTPVIFLTAATGASEVARLTSLGAAGVLIKPFDPRTLARDLRALLRA